MGIKKIHWLLLGLIVILLGITSYIAIQIKEEKEEKEQNQKKINTFLKEKEDLLIELKQLSKNLEGIELENSDLQTQLTLSKTKTDSLYQVISVLKPKISFLNRYRNQINRLKTEKSNLFQINDSLQIVNRLIKDSLEAKKLEIKAFKVAQNELNFKNEKLNSKIKKRKDLAFYESKGMGVYVKKNGKILKTDRLKKVNQIKVCTYAKPDNQLISESKMVYFKLFNPDKKLLGDLISKKNKKGRLIKYSDKQRFFYNNEKTEICKFISIDPSKIVSGTYTLEVYFDTELKDISEFRLR